MKRLAYRSRQFFQSLFARRHPLALARAGAILNPSMLALFAALPPAEQAHALRVLDELQAAGHDEPDLLAAGLLHDVGKMQAPLRLWEKVLVVLAGWFVGERWRQSPPRGLKRAFVVAAQHPDWGAHLVARAGGSDQLVALIQRHQDPVPEPPTNELQKRLLALQRADNES